MEVQVVGMAAVAAAAVQCHERKTSMLQIWQPTSVGNGKDGFYGKLPASSGVQTPA
ncbi:MAG: hypothetical protein ABI970_25745 [Chloroflexota bacterium]|nr:hypothetical protein [Anaerolineae bacterium]